MSDVKRFFALFQGNKRSFGRWYPNSGSMETEKIEPTIEVYESHLRGKIGLGLVPILDNGTCRFAAIDIDVHGEDESIDLVELEAKVRKNNLPLLTCRSKSGGAHLYLFCHEPLPAEDVRTLMSTWAGKLGHPGVEVFPKQSRLRPTESGDRPYGNWINLPYFNVAKTDRYFVDDGKPRDFEYFLSVAETRKITADTLRNLVHGEHHQAPPCVQKFLSSTVESYRNETLFAIGVYYQMRYEDDWRDRLMDLNSDRDFMPNPLSAAEVRKIADSLRKGEYSYRCAQEPCSSNCVRDECLKREYGIRPEDVQLESLLSIQQLIKVDTRPATYYLVIQGNKCQIDSVGALINPYKFREMLVENTNMYLPKISQREHDVLMKRLFENMQIVDAPKEASIHGALLDSVEEYLHRANVDADYSDPHSRMPLISGQPIVYTDSDGKRFYAFKSDGLRNYLKKTRQVDVPQAQNLFNTLCLKYKITVTKLSVGDLPPSRRPRVWLIPYDQAGDPIKDSDFPEREFEEEI